MELGTLKDVYSNENTPILHRRFPGVRAPSSHALAEFSEMYGVEILSGPFTPQEDKRIRKNFRRFCRKNKLENGVTTQCALLGFKLKESDEMDSLNYIKKLIKPLGFSFELARKMPNRTLASVYQRARKILCPFRNPKEVESKTKKDIIEYAKRCFGMKDMFAYIANECNCHPDHVRKIVSRKLNLEEKIEYKTGAFSRKENIRLYQAICHHLEIPLEDLTSCLLKNALERISWSSVAAQVKSRSSEMLKARVFKWFKSTTLNFDTVKFLSMKYLATVKARKEIKESQKNQGQSSGERD